MSVFLLLRFRFTSCCVSLLGASLSLSVIGVGTAFAIDAPSQSFMNQALPGNSIYKVSFLSENGFVFIDGDEGIDGGGTWSYARYAGGIGIISINWSNEGDPSFISEPTQIRLVFSSETAGSYTYSEGEGEFQYVANGNFDYPWLARAEVSVSYSGTNIVDGDTFTSINDGTNFGDVDFTDGSVTRTFRVSNIGEYELTLGAVTSSSDEFALSGLSSSISAGSYDDFTVTFDPSSTGAKTATISFSSNDSDEDPFDFAVSGVGVAAEIGVSYNGINIVDGAINTSLNDGTSFGGVNYYFGGSVTRIFRVTNTGDSELILSAAISTSDEFVVSGLSPIISVDNYDDFMVTFNPRSVGVRSSTISFSTNDSDENPFNFTVSGGGLEAVVEVSGLGVRIFDSDDLPDVYDGTSFGSVDHTDGSVTHVFRVTNSGNDVLILGEITSSSDEFTVGGLSSSILPDSYADFTVTLNPNSAGIKGAVISFSTNDSDDNPFNFSVSGEGTAPSSAFAPDVETVAAKLPGQAVNGTDFTSSTRFNWNGELGNWSYGLISADVGALTQTYDEEANNPNVYREETTLTFLTETSGTYVYREYVFNGLDLQTNGTFNFPWLVDATPAWYASASYLSDGWRYFDWFKGFKPEGENWIYHGRHGWLYTLGDDTSGLFLWDVALGRWMFTNETAYPWMYAYGSGGGWIFFFEGGRPGSRYFKRGDTGAVVSEQDLGLN